VSGVGWLDAVGALVALLLFAYLVFALIRAEDF
jgi:K+-transporting ATPase KdpF subunit